MVIIKTNKKLLKIILIIVLVSSFGFNIYSYSRNIELANKYKLLICYTSKLDKTNLITFLVSSNIRVQENLNIEIFDISKGSVIKKIHSNQILQSEVEKYLKGITGLYVKVKAIPDKGYIIKIPLEPSVKVQNQWLIDYDINSVDEVFIIFPEQETPYLLVLDNKDRPLFYTFEGNTNELLKNLNFQPETSQ